MKTDFDAIVIGSGLGGLECGLILAKEGWNVCVLEQDMSYGGCFQSFLRKGRYIDTGIHFVGSMGEGQILRQYFRYFGIFDRLSVIQLDQDFDSIRFKTGKVYSYRHGYEDFVNSLADEFPSEKIGLQRYADKIKAIGDTIGVEVHESGRLSSGGLDYLGISAWDFICECVSDPLLRNVLAGINPLYGGKKDAANLYHHAMIAHSNIEGCYRFVGGTRQVADLLVDSINSMGGTMRNRCKVARLMADGDKIRCIETMDGERLTARYYISDMHPAVTFNMLEGVSVVKKAYRTRLNVMPDTYGLFSVYLLMRPGQVFYRNKNYYFYVKEDVWDTVMESDLRAKAMMLSMQLGGIGQRYTDVVTLMSPVSTSLFSPWLDIPRGKRSEAYGSLKSQIEQNMMLEAESCFPGLLRNVETVYSASPLTYKDYTGTPAGSAYGLLKDCRRPLMSLIPARTKLSNLLLTGQNLNVHGALGVTLTAATTCSELIGMEYLAKKIGRA